MFCLVIQILCLTILLITRPILYLVDSIDFWCASFFSLFLNYDPSLASIYVFIKFKYFFLIHYIDIML